MTNHSLFLALTSRKSIDVTLLPSARQRPRLVAVAFLHYRGEAFWHSFWHPQERWLLIASGCFLCFRFSPPNNYSSFYLSLSRLSRVFRHYHLRPTNIYTMAGIVSSVK